MAVLDRTIELTPDAAKTVRHALLAGLAAVSEIERVLHRAEDAPASGTANDTSLLPRHPTESDDLVPAFVEALALLD